MILDHPGVVAARHAYARDHIDIQELERRLEVALLAEAGPACPTPRGWAPLPECDHDWIEVTRIGDPGHSLLCRHCTAAQWRSS